jgi:predicted DsbA family dithiol-disulfide isomerase
VRWLPFQLNPDLPTIGISRREYIERKWGAARGPEAYSRVAAVGKSVGLPMAFEKISVQPNTLQAHRLLHFADQRGRQDEVAEELFKAYFVEGANLAQDETLVEIGERAGLNADELRAYFAGDEDRESVQQGDIDARNAGIGGVPFFIFNRRIAVSGAQEADTLLQAMEESLKEPV